MSAWHDIAGVLARLAGVETTGRERDARAALASLTESHGILVETYDRARLDGIRLQRELEALTRVLDRTRREREELLDKIEGLSARRDTSESAVEQLAKQRDALESTVEQITKERDQARALEANTRRERDALHEEAIALRHDCQRLRQDLRYASNEIESLKRQIASTKARGETAADAEERAHAADAAVWTREMLGRRVREVWIEWAREQADPQPGWLIPWTDLPEHYREVDRRIGERMYRDGWHAAQRDGCAATNAASQTSAALKTRIIDALDAVAPVWDEASIEAHITAALVRLTDADARRGLVSIMVMRMPRADASAHEAGRRLSSVLRDLGVSTWRETSADADMLRVDVGDLRRLVDERRVAT